MSEENRRRIKNRIKMHYLNLRIYGQKQPFHRADYIAAEQKYNDYTDRIIQAIRAYPTEHDIKPQFREPAEPIVPDEYISIIGDDMGRVFRYQGKIYRGIYPGQIAFFERLWASGILQVLAENRLIPHVSISDYCTDEFPLVLEAETVTVQKNTVWTYAMIKDACILITVLKAVLNPFGYSLIDGHLNNVVFHEGNPMFIDIGSIIPLTDNGFMRELVFAGIYRLAFAFTGNFMMRRLPVHDDANTNMRVFPRPQNELTREYQTARKIMKRYFFLHGGFFARNIVRRVFDNCDFGPQDIEFLFPACTEDNSRPFIHDWAEAADVVTGLSEISSVLTLAGTEGRAEEAILKKKPELMMTCIDFQEDRLDQCYLRLKELRKNTSIFLYNYVYLLDEQAEAIKADAVLSVDPLNDRGTFWPVADEVLAYKLCRLVNRYLILFFAKENEAQYQAFFDTCLSNRMEKLTSGYFEEENSAYLVLELKKVS